jgi:hypothetical protein
MDPEGRFDSESALQALLLLHPICAIAIRERDQEAFAVLDRDDGRVEGPTRSASDVTNDRGVRSALSGRSEREGPRQSRETAQGALGSTLHALTSPPVGARGRA